MHFYLIIAFSFAKIIAKGVYVMAKIFLSIDFTPSNTTIYREGKGIVLDEPNKVLCQNDYDEVRLVAFGSRAEKSEQEQFVIYPVTIGGVDSSELVYARQMFANFIRRVVSDKPNANIVAKFVVSCGVSLSFKKAIRSLAYYSGISEIDFVPYPIADMIGCGITFDDFLYCMIIDINTSNTDIAILCQDGILDAVSINVGTQNFEQAIYEQIKYRYGLSLSSETVGEVLRTLGSLSSREAYELSYSGVDIRSAITKTVRINSKDIYGAIKDYYIAIGKTAYDLYVKQSQEIRENLNIQGAIFCGRGSNVPSLADFMGEHINLPIFVANYDCTLYGLGKLTKNKVLYKKMMKKVA